MNNRGSILVYILTVRLKELLSKLNTKDGGAYWGVQVQTRLEDAIIGTRFDEEAYEAAVLHVSLSDKMYDQPVNRKNYEHDIIEKRPVEFNRYTLDLAAYLRAKGYEPIIFREFYEAVMPSSDIIIDFSGCRDVATLNIKRDKDLLRHLQLDVMSFTRENRVHPLPVSLAARCKEIFLTFREDECVDTYKKSKGVFKAMIQGFFPKSKLIDEEIEKKEMARLRLARDAHQREVDKAEQRRGPVHKPHEAQKKRSAPDTGLFWNKAQESTLNDLEKKYKKDSVQEQAASPSL